MLNCKWTLVQHSGYGYAQKPAFEHAVEMRSISEAQAKKITALGGLVFESWNDANAAEYATNYGPEVQGLHPAAKGKFARMRVDGLKVFLPAKTEEKAA